VCKEAVLERARNSPANQGSPDRPAAPGVNFQSRPKKGSIASGQAPSKRGRPSGSYSKNEVKPASLRKRENRDQKRLL